VFFFSQLSLERGAVIMSNSRSPYTNLFLGVTVGLIAITIIVYILRGVGILTFIPGGVIYFLFLSAIALGFLAKLAHRQRW
jgi:hypothetical protein